LSPWWSQPTADSPADDQPTPEDASRSDKDQPRSAKDQPRKETRQRSSPRRSKPDERPEAEPRDPDAGSRSQRGGNKDAGKKDTGEQDSAKRSSGKRDSGKRDAGKRDAGKRDAGKKDAAKKDAGERDAGKKDSKKDADERGDRGARGRRGGDDRATEADFTFDAEVSPDDIAKIIELQVSAPERNTSVSDEKKIALFCDLENIAIGVRDSDIKKFDINLVLERLLEKGKIIVKKAYCDWERYSEYKRPFHEAAIEMIDIPQRYYSGKNSADIKMVVDAMDLSYAKEHLDTFTLLSGDSDFSPLVSKLKENNKYVIGIGVKGASSNLLIDNCDEFIYYEDVWRDRQKAPKLSGSNKKTAEAFSLMVDAIQALLRENKDVLWGSMIKQTMQRKKPSFNEGYYGYSSFSELLEDAERNKIIKLKKDQRSGTYIVTGFASPK